MQKLISIQVLRGISAMLIVVHHYMQQFYNFSSTNVIGDFFSDYGSFGVDIFFTLSGFIMAHTLLLKGTDYISFAKNRFLRVVPNYWFYTLLIVILGMLNTEIHSSSANFNTIVQSLLFIPHENPDPILGVYPTLTVGWTLNMEMFFYSVLTLVLLLKGTMVKKCIVAIMALVVLPFIYKMIGWEFYQSVAGNPKLFEFSAGIVIGIVYVLHAKFFHCLLLKSISVVFLLATIYLTLPEIMVNVIISTLILYFTLVLNESFNLENAFIRFWVYLGEISYSIYLSHAIVIPIIWLLNPNLDSFIEEFLVLSSIIVLTIVISDISFRVIEKKFTKYLKIKLKGKNPKLKYNHEI